jgi:hypothetical protein
MVVKDDISSLRGHIEMLENRLDEYHEHLVDAIRERDEIAVDAAWGVAQALAYFQSLVFSAAFGVMAFFAVLEFVSRVLAVVMAGSVFAVSYWWSLRSLVAINRARVEEKEGLARLPEWKSEAEKLW